MRGSLRLPLMDIRRALLAVSLWHNPLGLGIVLDGRLSATVWAHSR